MTCHGDLERTIAHSAPEYANKEQDLIRQSFTRGNHTWMKESLPVELGPDAVNMLRPCMSLTRCHHTVRTKIIRARFLVFPNSEFNSLQNYGFMLKLLLFEPDALRSREKKGG
eukprot:3861136-Amphidinium_carterae.1